MPVAGSAREVLGHDAGRAAQERVRRGDHPADPHRDQPGEPALVRRRSRGRPGRRRSAGGSSRPAPSAAPARAARRPSAYRSARGVAGRRSEANPRSWPRRARRARSPTPPSPSCSITPPSVRATRAAGREAGPRGEGAAVSRDGRSAGASRCCRRDRRSRRTAPGLDVHLAHLDPALGQLLAGGVGVGDDHLHAMLRARRHVGDPDPITTEQADPGGVSCTNRSSRLTRWSWSALNPTWST